MKLHLSAPSNQLLRNNIQITGSKSESNRSLLLQALYPNISIDNLSNSDDAEVMQKGLKIGNGVVDIHHAGTAMRFLTGFFASQEGKQVTLTGSKRMTERPVKVLVEALRHLGAEISYGKNEGYPPILIKGKKLEKSQVSLPANISSQYISSLLLIAPSLENGLELELVGKITSVPYIKMTLALLSQIGVENSFEGNTIKVSPKAKVGPVNLVVESDWSSASYYYSIVALSEVGSEICLSAYKDNSLQGDSVLQELYTEFGVETRFEGNTLVLRKVGAPKGQTVQFDLGNAPDIAQTIAVTCFGLGMGCHLTGLHTLKIKETDRLEALHTELSKLGADISVTDKDLTLGLSGTMKAEVAIDTYNDHRMAMAFAPLAMKIPLYVNDAEVVSKSYPDFWKDLEKLTFLVDEV
ncbi:MULTISPECIES: 3-phosphoshikimate 1-carboxyvinyltransferase [Zobellia]|uniref:3-phosphoshikimate 1-carboxyvinyltransferase n=1 Tax=Zobellia galactanivorans (strain DSM 12802 / CCUG 47099 / CIP 106680 / NCIMB 13871 / Dsij) TaxID=63186 RepID=G0L225_ZOBGA|nr:MULTISPECIES: 3-phosphoshikimate 1-carboxyvinyltransferase [Zobellia]OWW24332.1 3-phosphoshikimate 1-carboxyvinyltransferase [Zobellia sp. OII3]CAZ94884.1 3-Phosphoshikimate 1-carboxyvinyltransferase [Zobellia galactanivorans]